MAITISAPYKTNTLASVSGTTFTSNGTPFSSGDVGRFIVFTNGPARGQIRRIVGFTSSTTVTVDLAWDQSNVIGFTDLLPSSGDTWVMSLKMDDIDDGTHIIKVNDNIYRANPSAGAVTIGAGVFIADTSLLFEADFRFLLLDPAAFWQFGYLAAGGYGVYGCGITDTGSSNGWSGVVSGLTGDVHLYGCNINSNLTGPVFWRLYRGDDHIVRFVDCDFSGNFGGRVRGSRSVLLRCTYRGNAGSSTAGIAAVADFGLIQECRVQASDQAIYCAYSLGIGTVTSPRFDAISETIFSAATLASDVGTYVIEDYIESEVTSAANVVKTNNFSANAKLSFRQWIDGSIVDSSLALITDSARRVIRNNAASVVDNATATSGTFSRYTAEVRLFTMETTNQAWTDGTSFGPYDQTIASYAWQAAKLSLPLAESSDVQFTLQPDDFISEANTATVAAYSSLDDLDQLYDRAKLWFVDNLALAFPSFGVQPVNANGTAVDLGNRNIVINAAAATVFDVNTGTNTITVDSSALAAGSNFSELKTTGTITFANGGTATARLSGILTYSAPSAITQSIGTATLRFATAGTYDLRGANISGTVTLENTSGGNVTVQLLPSVTFVNSGPSITVDNAATANVSITGLTAGSRLRIYNDTTDTEVVNQIVSGTSYSATYEEGTGYSEGDNIRIRLTYANTTTAKISYQGAAIVGTSGWSLLAQQEDDTVYAAFNVDGSTINRFSADYINDQVDIVVGNNFYLYDFYAWWVYNLTTEDGVRDFFGGITAIDQANIRINTDVLSLYLDNSTNTNIRQLDNRRFYRSDGQYPVLDPTTGGGGIDVVWRNQIFIAEVEVNAGTTPVTEVNGASVTRSDGDQTPILFTFPLDNVAGVDFVKIRRINGGTSEPIAGTVTYLYEISGKYWYRLAYDASDRPSGDGTAQYVFTNSGKTAVINLHVSETLDSTEAQAAAAAALNAYDAPTKAELDLVQAEIQADIAGIETELTTSDIEAIATAVESAILDETDGQAILEAIVNAIGNENIDEIALVAAIRADLERAGGSLDNLPTLSEIEATSVLAKEATITALNNISVSDINSVLETYDAPTKAELDSAVANLSTFDPTTDVVITDTESREASKADLSGIEDNLHTINEGVKKASLLIPHTEDI